MSQYGNFGLDEDVNAKLKSWKVPENDLTRREKVTLRRILSHSAGFTVHGFPGYAQGASLPTLQEILDGKAPANTASIRVDIEPGSKWRYSGGGYTVLQQLIIDRFGKAFPDIMRILVLKPIGMTRSTFEQPLPTALAGNAARAYARDGTKVDGNWHTYPEMAAAGLWTTPSDLARFSIELWRASRGESNRIIEARTAREMLNAQKGDYGLGVGIGGNAEDQWFGHGGSNVGFHCRWVMFLASGRGAVIMTNNDQGGQIIDEVLRSIAVAENWPALQPEKKLQ